MSDYLETDTYTKTLGDALDSVSVETSSGPIDDGLIHLSTGVVLAPQKVSPFIFQAVADKFKDPPIPTVWIEEKGRNEPNPMHPEYLKAKEATDVARSMATIDATIALGTKLVSAPQTFPSLTEEDWLDDLEVAGISIDRSNTRLRYRTWIKYIAAPSVDDIQLVISKVLKFIGVTEEAVATAVAGFPHKP